MHRYWKHLVAALFVIIFAGCSGGGCSGCSGCAGAKPLPGGFPADSRIENAAGVRLTTSGLGFLQANIPALAGQLLGSSGSASGGVLTFEVPETGGSQCLGATVGGTCLGVKFNYTVCKGGADPNASPPKCVAEIDLASSNFQITTSKPHDVKVAGTLKVRIQDLPVDTSLGGLRIIGSGNGDCNNPTFADIPLSDGGNPGIDISIETELDAAHPARMGYSKVKVNSLKFDQNKLIDAVKACDGGFLASAVNLLKGVIGGQLVGGLTGSLGGTLDSALCTQANPNATPSCPNGSTDQGGTCKFADGSCVSTMLGLDGEVDLGSLVASISPGTRGGLQYLFSVGGAGQRDNNSGGEKFTWGDLDPINGGATLSMMGGTLPTPIANCIPLASVTPPAGIPVPDELRDNAIPNWPSDVDGPHVGIALSERFANYAMANLYNSGLLCLGLSTDSIAQINSGLFSLLVPSIGTLTYQTKAQSLAITVRPQKPPVVTFGNGTDLDKDPNVRVQLPQAAMDFYVWSSDRYIRAFTATFDLDVPLNLDVSAAGLKPVLKNIGVNNPKVTNADLLKEDPAAIGSALAQILGSVVGQVAGGSLPTVDLNAQLSSLGLQLIIPPTVMGQGSPGLRKLTKGTDNFLGIFATLAIPTTTPMIRSATNGRLLERRIDPAGLRLATMSKDNAPVARVLVSSPLDDGQRVVEYAWRVDRGFWRPWTTDRELLVDDPVLAMQAKHVVQVASRVRGMPQTESAPLAIPVVVDIDPPVVTLGHAKDGSLPLEAFDLVSQGDGVKVRWAFDDGQLGAWTPATEATQIAVPAEARSIQVEAQDEEGNVASTSQALIRGRPDPTLASGSSGCGCRVAGDTRSRGGDAALFAFGLGALGVALRARRRRAAASATTAGATSATTAGATKEGATAAPRARRSLAPRSGLQVLSALAVLGIAGSWAGCSCGGGDSTEDLPPPGGPGADAATNPDGCVNDPSADNSCTPLVPGLIGSYTSTAVGSDGTVWVAGYNDGDFDSKSFWGDLVVGKWDGSKVTWTSVDGVPSDEVDTSVYDPTGFRGGQSEPGDDVGQWTSIAVGEDGNPMVAYYDVSHHALKFAWFDGTTWTTSTVDKGAGDAGRYAKLLVVKGNPVIAYQSILAGDKTKATSKVRVARGSSAHPASASDWTFEDVAVDAATPCRATLCATGQVCLASNTTCTSTASGCKPSCSAPQACIAGEAGAEASCQDTLDKSKLDTYPEAIGDYISLAQAADGSLGVVFYDRIHGNLIGAKETGGKWAPTLLDGQTGAPPDVVDTGDVGVGAHLAIDGKGDWHVTYVDGISESLKYLLVKGGTTAQTPEIIDDGLGIAGKPFADGRHIIGDDSFVSVSASGDVRVSYQDASSGKLRWANGTPKSGGGHTWALKEITQDGFSGFFSSHVVTADGTQIANWWRTGGKAGAKGDVRLVSP